MSQLSSKIINIDYYLPFIFVYFSDKTLVYRIAIADNRYYYAIDLTNNWTNRSVFNKLLIFNPEEYVEKILHHKCPLKGGSFPYCDSEEEVIKIFQSFIPIHPTIF